MCPVEYADHPALPQPAGYRHAAVSSGAWIHTSGQTWASEDGDLVEQTRGSVAQALLALEGAGGGAQQVIHLQLFVVGLDPDRAGSVYRGIGLAARDATMPAVPTTVVGVSGLAVPGALVEVVAIGSR